MNPNNTAISVLKSSIERKQMCIEDLEQTIRSLNRGLFELNQSIGQLKRHKSNEIQQLALIAKVEKVEIDWHSIGVECDDDYCQSCFPVENKTEGDL